MSDKKVGARIELILYREDGNLTENNAKPVFYTITTIVRFFRLFGIKFGAVANGVLVDDLGRQIKWEKL